MALLSGAGIGGLAAGYAARPSLEPERSTTRTTTVVAEMSAADIVHLRFPADWTETAGEAGAPAMLAFASADGITLFNPRPIYPVASASEPAPEAPATLAAATPATPKPAVQQTAAAPAPAPTKIALASTTSKPIVHAKPTRPNAVLSDSQIASIKKRLNLTPDQERYWPAVAAELRKMEYAKGANAKGTRTASIDMSKVDVDGLKSAGFPLVMSFNDEQRRELKSLAHLLGLDSVMSGL